MSQVLLSEVRMRVWCYAEMAPSRGAWIAGEPARYGHRVSAGTPHPVFYRVQNEGLLGPDWQVIDGQVRRAYDLTGHGIWALERPEFTLGLGQMKMDP
jgi:hypothetical protein